MANKEESLPITLLEQFDTTSTGYDVLRYISLPNLLGAEKDILLYFMGKNLARTFEIEAIGDIIYFFEKVGWGKLDLYKEKRNELVFQLLSDQVVRRIDASIETDFRLEAGFLAESVHKIRRKECECVESINKKLRQVEFRVLFVE